MSRNIIHADIEMMTQQGIVTTGFDEITHANGQLAILKNALVALSARLPATKKSKVLAILTAPEYFFSKPYTGSGFQLRHYSRDTVTYIFSCLSKYSAEYPNVLIVPGTIAWKFKPTRADLQQAFVFLRDNATQIKISGYRDGKGNALAGAVYNQATVLKVARIKKSLEKKDLGSDSLKLARNTAVVYFEGKRIHHYDKCSDWHEVIDNSDTVFLPGNSNLEYSLWEKDGLRFATEICFDHADGIDVLGVIAEKYSGKIDPRALTVLRDGIDFHLIFSAWTANRPNAYVREGGYRIHSSIYPSNPATGEAVRCVEQIRFDGSGIAMPPIESYVIALGVAVSFRKLNLMLTTEPAPVVSTAETLVAPFTGGPAFPTGGPAPYDFGGAVAEKLLIGAGPPRPGPAASAPGAFFAPFTGGPAFPTGGPAPYHPGAAALRSPAAAPTTGSGVILAAGRMALYPPGGSRSTSKAKERAPGRKRIEEYIARARLGLKK